MPTVITFLHKTQKIKNVPLKGMQRSYQLGLFSSESAFKGPLCCTFLSSVGCGCFFCHCIVNLGRIMGLSFSVMFACGYKCKDFMLILSQHLDKRKLQLTARSDMFFSVQLKYLPFIIPLLYGVAMESQNNTTGDHVHTA